MATRARPGSVGPSPQQPAQEGDALGHVGQAVVAGLPLDGQPAAVLDFFEHAQVPRPVDVAVAQRYLSGGPAGTGAADIPGVAVQDKAPQGASAVVGVKAVLQQV